MSELEYESDVLEEGETYQTRIGGVDVGITYEDDSIKVTGGRNYEIEVNGPVTEDEAFDRALKEYAFRNPGDMGFSPNIEEKLSK